MTHKEDLDFFRDFLDTKGSKENLAKVHEKGVTKGFQLAIDAAAKLATQSNQHELASHIRKLALHKKVK